PVAHLEAGLRSFNRQMPEEHNRVLTDHCADLLLAPTQVAAEHLAREGVDPARVVVTGDVMTDVLYQVMEQVRDNPSPFPDLGPGEYSVATIHRAENTDDARRLEAIIDSLGAVDHPVVLLAHPRLIAKCEHFGVPLKRGHLQVHDPVPYPELVSAVLNSRGVITDSGGLQKEAFLMRVPCTTVRPETEWVETVELGWNVLVQPGGDLTLAASRPRPAPTDAAPYGTGQAAQIVADALQTMGSRE
ncbi:UDP-N-acetylglucosamine 2-epimerase, partial [Actinomyces sp. F1_1611]